MVYGNDMVFCYKNGTGCVIAPNSGTASGLHLDSAGNTALSGTLTLPGGTTFNRASSTVNGQLTVTG